MTEEELSQEELDRALEAGFNKAVGAESSPAKPEPKADAETPQPESSKETTDEIPDDESEVVKDDETKEEKEPPKDEAKDGKPSEPNVDEAINRAIESRLNAIREERITAERKMFGKLGAMEAAIKRLHDRPTVGNRKMADEAIKEMSEEYPELAGKMKKVVDAISGQEQPPQKQAPAFDPALLQAQLVDAMNKQQAALTDKFNKEKEELQFAIIEDRHQDYKQVLNGTEFKKWFEALPDERKKQYSGTNSGFVISRMITEYKESVKRQAKVKEEKTKKLERAVAPKTVETSPKKQLTDDEYLELGFRKAQGKA